MAFDFINDVLGAPFRALGIEPSHIPLAGPLLFDDPAQEAYQKKIRNAQAAYGQQQQIDQQARMQALNQILDMYQPVQNALTNIYGPQAQIPTDQLRQNPYPQQQQQQRFPGMPQNSIAGAFLGNKSPAAGPRPQPQQPQMTPGQRVAYINEMARRPR